MSWHGDVWTVMEGIPGFSADLREAERALAAGEGVPFEDDPDEFPDIDPRAVLPSVSPTDAPRKATDPPSEEAVDDGDYLGGEA